jgi:hypothetical protein
MPLRIGFHKLTREGLSVDIEEYEGVPILILGKDEPRERPIQILGVAGREVNTGTLLWHYEYEPLPGNIPFSRLARYLESLGYTVGLFDQYCNFRRKAAWYRCIVVSTLRKVV